ncbi:hypothetical protein DWZ93_13475 [Dorea sp. AF36-15AT]|nr:hypothetical protein DWZ93_13475 [Dorea sp. AF36-15AT]
MQLHDAHLCKSTLRFGRRKTIVHRTMCALPEAISAGWIDSQLIYIKPAILSNSGFFNALTGCIGRIIQNIIILGLMIQRLT